MAGYISVTDSEENEKSYIFWNFTNEKLMIQNGSELIGTLTQQNKSDDEIRESIKDEESAQLLLNPLGGKIGICTDDPLYTLDVNGDLGISGSLILKKISDYDSPKDYFIEPGAEEVAGSFNGNIGLGTKTPSEKLTIKSVNDLDVTPNEIKKSTIRFESWNKKDSEETINKTYSIGIINSKFSLLDSSDNIVFSIDDVWFNLNRKFFISELTVDKITVNQNIKYKSIIVDENFSADVLTANTGTITSLNSTQSVLTNLNSTNSTISNLQVTNSIIFPTLPNLDVSNKISSKDLEISNTTTTKNLEVVDSANIKTLFVDQKEIKLEDLISKFDSILDDTESDVCEEEWELYPLSTKCIVSSLNSTGVSQNVTLEDSLWLKRSAVSFSNSATLPIKNMNKIFSFEFYFKLNSSHIYGEEKIISIQSNNSQLNLNVTYRNDVFKVKLESSDGDTVEIESETDSKPLNSWRHFKFSMNMNNDIFRFYLDGRLQSDVDLDGSFSQQMISPIENFYFKTETKMIITDLLFIPDYNISLTHFNSNKPWRSKSILIGKNSSFHLDENGNFWAKKVWQ